MTPSTWVMFAVWIAYGIFQWRRSHILLPRLLTIPREKRPLRATLWLFGSAVFLLAALYATFLVGGFPKEGMTPAAWVICLITGLIFVHGQTMAGALLVSMAVTPSSPDASQSKKDETSL